MSASNSGQETYLRLMALKGYPEGHEEVWRWLFGKVESYPRDRKFWPWRRAKRVDRWRPIAMVGGTPAVHGEDSKPRIAGLTLHRPPRDETLEVGDGPEAARAIAGLLFTDRTRRTSLIVPDGSRWVFDALLRDHVATWVDDGLAVTPLVAGYVIKGMVVRKGRNRWTLSDFEAMTGSTPERALDDATTPPTTRATERSSLAELAAWVSQLQRVSLETFGVYLRPTLPGTAVRAAGFELPPEELIPRNPPWVVALCRSGLGYRGGYVYGEKYRGPAWKADARRLYARSLCEELGVGWGLGRCSPDGHEKPGVFVCTISGTALHPVQLGTWEGPDEGFRLRLWSEGTAIAVVPSSEFAGLRAMGLDVLPGWGWVATDTISFAPFVDKLQRVLNEHGPESGPGRMAKLLGNSLYGRLAVNPSREVVVWSRSEPSGDVFPLVTIKGEEIPDMWSVREVRYSPSQQVGAAAMVTGWARGYLYEEMARRIKDGARIVHAHTDGYLAVGPVPADLPWDTSTIGAWRLVSVDDDAIVARAGGYTIGGETKWSGAPNQGRRTLEIAWTTGGWTVKGRKTRPKVD